MTKKACHEENARWAFLASSQLAGRHDGDFGNKHLVQGYGLRIYSPEIGKFLSVDPLAPSYPWYAPYQFAGNSPVKFIDLDGLEEALPKKPDTKPQIRKIGFLEFLFSLDKSLDGSIPAKKFNLPIQKAEGKSQLGLPITTYDLQLKKQLKIILGKTVSLKRNRFGLEKNKKYGKTTRNTF